MTGQRPIALFNLRAAPKPAPVEPAAQPAPVEPEATTCTTETALTGSPKTTRRSWIALASGVWLAPVLKRGDTNVA
jgi:hypothetical protein